MVYLNLSNNSGFIFDFKTFITKLIKFFSDDVNSIIRNIPLSNIEIDSKWKILYPKCNNIKKEIVLINFKINNSPISIFLDLLETSINFENISIKDSKTAETVIKKNRI